MGGVYHLFLYYTIKLILKPNSVMLELKYLEIRICLLCGGGTMLKELKKNGLSVVAKKGRVSI